MKTILVWYLITVGYNSAIHWSPAMATLEECQRVQKVYAEATDGKRAKCIQLNEVMK